MQNLDMLEMSDKRRVCPRVVGAKEWTADGDENCGQGDTVVCGVQVHWGSRETLIGALERSAFPLLGMIIAAWGPAA